MNNLDNASYPVPTNPGETYQGHSNIDGFTKRERACIDLRIPESGDAELDALIEKARRQDFAAKAMQGLLSSASGEYVPMDVATGIADELIADLERADG